MKLDEINKKNIFTTPEGYFDDLPQIIQAKIAKQSSSINNIFNASVLKWSFTVVIIALIGGIYFTINNKVNSSSNEILTQTSSEAIIDFLAESDLNTYDITSEVALSNTISQEILNEQHNVLSIEDADILMLELEDVMIEDLYN